jgi:hypothetical protein
LSLVSGSSTRTSSARKTSSIVAMVVSFMSAMVSTRLSSPERAMLLVKIFISHSSLDKAFAKQLAADLIAAGHSVFLDEWVIKAGACITNSITSGITECDVLALILSAHSVESKWVDEEWKSAHWEEISHGAMRVIPLLLSDCEIPLLLRKRKYADFRSDYSQGIAELLDGVEGPSIDNSYLQASDSNEVDWSTLDGRPLFPEAAQLADFMSDISELLWHARWLEGLEYMLWELVISGRPTFPSGFASGYFVTPEHLSILKSLSAACGGWVAFPGWCKVWVPIEYWKNHFSHPNRFPIHDRVFTEPEVSVKRPLYAFVDRLTTRSLKQEALLFDKIAVPDVVTSLYPEERWGRNKRELVKLVQSGVIIPAIPLSTFHIRGEAERALAARIDSAGCSSLEREALYERLIALQFSRIHGAEAYPVYETSKYHSTGTDKARERVIRVVFSKIPMPSQEVSWDHILEYRKDPDSLRRFSALRVWVNQMARQRMSEPESRDLLESLLADFEAHLRLHKLRFLYRSLGVVVCCDQERVKELAQSSKATDKCQYATMQDLACLDLLEAELTAPGREIAYLSFTRKTFATR